MSSVLVSTLFLLGLFFIIKGGDILVRAALNLNKVTGISPVIIGATFVSVATTLPEVFVSIFAVAKTLEKTFTAILQAEGAKMLDESYKFDEFTALVGLSGIKDLEKRFLNFE